jgi:hypothetical protein
MLGVAHPVAVEPALSTSDSETRPPPPAKTDEPAAAAAAGVHPEADVAKEEDTSAIGLPEFVSAALRGATPEAVAEVLAVLGMHCSTTEALLAAGADAGRLVGAIYGGRAVRARLAVSLMFHVLLTGRAAARPASDPQYAACQGSTRRTEVSAGPAKCSVRHSGRRARCARLSCGPSKRPVSVRARRRTRLSSGRAERPACSCAPPRYVGPRRGLAHGTRCCAD